MQDSITKKIIGCEINEILLILNRTKYNSNNVNLVIRKYYFFQQWSGDALLAFRL
jgi:hypothetical protein